MRGGATAAAVAVAVAENAIAVRADAVVDGSVVPLFRLEVTSAGPGLTVGDLRFDKVFAKPVGPRPPCVWISIELAGRPVGAGGGGMGASLAEAVGGAAKTLRAASAIFLSFDLSSSMAMDSVVTFIGG